LLDSFNKQLKACYYNAQSDAILKASSSVCHVAAASHLCLQCQAV